MYIYHGHENDNLTSFKIFKPSIFEGNNSKIIIDGLYNLIDAFMVPFQSYYVHSSCPTYRVL